VANIAAGINIGITNGDGAITINNTSDAEANTASNQGSGIGVFDHKNGVDLELRSLLSTSNLLTIALDALNKEIDFTVNEENFDLANLGGLLNLGTQTSGTINLATQTSGAVNLTTQTTGNLNLALQVTGTLPINRGGTGTVTAPSDGKLLIGKTDGTYAVANLIAGPNVAITPGDGTITIGSSAGGGETNTASNQGSGIGVFDNKNDADLELRSFVSLNNLLTISLDALHKEIDFLINESNLNLANIGGFLNLATQTAGTVNLATQTSGNLNLSSQTTGTLPISKGGTGTVTVPSDGKLLIGKNDGSYAVANLSAGSNVTITPGDGTITIESADTGETNTASNQGVGGVGIFKQKSGADLELKNINAGSNKLSVTDDTGNNEVDLEVVEANINPANLSTNPLARANHTGTQSADTITDGTTNKAFTATEKTKLAGIAAGATANSSDATLLNRANHTGTQLAATISDFVSAVVSALANGVEGLTTAEVNQLKNIDATAISTAIWGFLATLNQNLATVSSPSFANLSLANGVTAGVLKFFEPSGSGTNFTALTAQAQSGDITYTLPALQGGVSTVLQNDGAGGLSWITPANTASNQGVGGVGVFKQKSGVDLQFKNINVGSNKLSVTNDSGNNEVDLDVTEANLSLANLGGLLNLSTQTSGNVNLSSQTTGTLPISKGGTGTTTAPSDGKLLIGKTDGSYGVANITAGANISITNGDGTISVAAAADGNSLDALDGSPTNVIAIDNVGHVVTSGSTPGVSACGTTPSISGNDTAGKVTVGGGLTVTSCTITFSSAYSSAPACVATGGTVVFASTTTTTLVLTTNALNFANSGIMYHCLQY